MHSAKRVTPDGDLAKDLANAGYHVDEMPEWFGSAAEVLDAEKSAAPSAGDAASDAESAAPSAEDAADVVLDAESAEEVVYLARKPHPIAQVQPGVYQAAPASASAPPASVPRSTALPASGQQLSAQQVALLAQHGITYDEPHRTWVRWR